MQHGGDIYTNGVLKGVELIDFSSNINPLGIPKSFKEHVYEAVNNLNRYPDAKYRSLIDNLKQYITEFKAEGENLILGNGAAEIIDLAIGSFKRLLIIAPSFGEYLEDAEKWGLNVEFSNLLEDMSYDYEDILEKIKQVDALIIGNPNNPNGGIIDKEKFKPILDYCSEHNKTVIIDEAFIEFTLDKKHSFEEELKNYNCIFIVRAITKFFAMPGIRFGYGISSNLELLDSMRKRQNPWNINCFAETAVKYVLKDDEYIKKSIEWIASEGKFLTNELKKIAIIDKVYDTCSNFVLCKLKNMDCNNLYNLCLNKGIVIRKCDNFKGLDSSFVRFAIKDREKNMILLDTLKNLL